MTAEIKVLHVSKKLITRTGKGYVKVTCLLILGTNEFIKEFLVFE